MDRKALLTFLTTAACLLGVTHSALALDYEDYPVVKLRTLDKITARTMTFEAKVGATMKFGEIFIKVQTCRKPPPVQKSEASAFLQIWETDTVKDQSSWIFSGWMFSSSPTLSAMNHPVYDVWVIDCIGKDPEELPPPEAATAEDEGVLPANVQPAVPSSEELGANGKSAPVPETPDATPGAAPTDAGTSGTIDVPADDSNAAVEETVPTSNMPADAVPLAPATAAPDTGFSYTPPATEAPQTEQAPAAPETNTNGGGSDGFQGIY